ncbi:2OG-Fe(II) oxygenase [Vibrio sp. TH_r3]|uniref:2OG-Fe(II) oxygenase n=1 Tax=Vibrio sp. TH_r3 TaxID=3082084 RepID=UPI002952DE54|nr:2OG-Fe(II) oxygenase [Vibrio sp. TH_r3]MDV7106347.1 2OG-Fe(II) oxygenase [Vibrio sp. TH_r3]
MINTNNIHTEASQLEAARHLTFPTREAMLSRAPSVQQFWDKNQQLLENAWREWEENERAEVNDFELDSSLLDPSLRNAIEHAWKDPSQERAVKELLHEVSPGVFQFQLFNPERLAQLRGYLEATTKANIPLRPPYGIALNRRGAMLDRRSEGFLAAPSFQTFYRELMDKYMRPIARLLFPEVMGYDTQTFGFSIEYQAGMDTSLRLHTDASAATMNVNLNLPGESFTGSEVDFYDKKSGSVSRFSFKPGIAMIHRGSEPHAAHPIKSGTRSNIVLWLYGDRGQIPLRNQKATLADAAQRWTVPSAKKDKFAPF